MSIDKPELTLYPTAGRLKYAISLLVEGGGDTARLVPGMMTIGQFEKKLRAQIRKARREVTRFGRSLMMSAIIETFYRNNRGGVFGPIHTFPGFLDSILNFFDELGAGLVAPDFLPEVKGYAPEKEKEIARLYSAYQRELEKRGLYDSGTLRRGLIEALSSKEWELPPSLKRFESIRLIDIYQFTPYRFELFKNLARRMKVTIVLPTPDNRQRAFGFIVSNIAKFEALGDRAGQLEIEFGETGGGGLALLKERIFDLSPPDKGSDKAEGLPVKILSCYSRYREMEEAGASIIEMVKQGGRRWSDFAVVFRDIKPYGAIVDDVFSRYSIPFYFKRGLSLGQNPLIRSALSLFGAINSGYGRDEIARIIGSSYFGKFTDIDIDGAQTLFIEAGIIDGEPSAWRRKLKKAVAGRKGASRNKADQIANLTGELIDALARLKRQNRPPQFLDHLTRLFTWLKLSPESQYSGPKSDIIRFRDNNAYMQLIETVLEAKQAVDRMKMGSSPLGFEVIRDMLIGQINNRTTPEPGAADLNRVQVLNVHDVIGLDFNHLFICGLNEGEFPLRAQARSILTEEERTAFNKAHIEALGAADPETEKGRRVFDRSSDKWQEESLLFFQAIKAAGDTLHFTYSSQELDGTPIMRSLFIDDALDTLAPGASTQERENVILHTGHLAIAKEAGLLPDPEEQKAKLLRDLFRGSASEQSLEERIGQIARGAPGWKRFTTLLSLAATERERDDYFIEPDPEKKKQLANIYNAGLASQKEKINSLLVGKRKGRYSPTALESFGQCPFRYFAGRTLGLEAVEEPALEMDARGAGTLNHAVLENFYKKMIKQKRLPLTGGDDEKNILVDTALKEFEKFRRKGLLGDMAIWEAQEEKTLSALVRWHDAEVEDQRVNGFIPVGVEVIFDFKPFDKSPDYKPCLISIPDSGDRHLTGRVDRIDIRADGNMLRVVDYKSGSNVAKYKKMVGRDNLGRVSFQPGIYMLLARDWVISKKMMDNVDSMRGGYRLIHMDEAGKAYVMTDGGKEKEVDDGSFLGAGDGAEQTSETFEGQVRSAIEKIESGQFYISPVNCDYCDFPGLCRYIATAKESAQAD
ncbi:hypothetical protein MNBD_NITROSPINAE03-1765 [hydrothermal vent metagenome]|uniref:UvrD-like helicase C-terminal domain-containing protein n=1 Tax=hydrothermal vent metagenome TaxID=652676 RepID=A0A3B1D3G0_9ZZZZ